MDCGDKLQGKQGSWPADLSLLKRLGNRRHAGGGVRANTTGILIYRCPAPVVITAFTMRQHDRIATVKSCQAQKFRRDRGACELTTTTSTSGWPPCRGAAQARPRARRGAWPGRQTLEQGLHIQGLAEATDTPKGRVVSAVMAGLRV